MMESSKRRDYHEYFWGRGELAAVILQSVGIVAVLAYFFYRSILAMLPLTVVGMAFFRMTREKKACKAREELALQFRECILSVATSLQAGYSVENAFLESYRDMGTMYGEDAAICRELLGIRRGLNINISLEELLLDLAERSDCEEIEQFAHIFSLAKRNGGNMSEIIRGAAGRIGRRMELRQEVNLLLSGRQMELTIMKVIPFGILLYINMGNPGYFDALYHNPTGIVIMTACLLVYLGAVVLGEHIMKRIVAELT